MGFVIPYTSIGEIPREEYKNLHKAYWKYIAESGTFLKPTIRFQDFREARISCDCFACQYAEMFSKSGMCDSCPITEWREQFLKKSFYSPIHIQCPCTMMDSPFKKWDSECDPEKRKELALQIANLEWEDI